MMMLKREMIDAIASRLWSNSSDARAYVYRYLFNSLQALSEAVPPRIASALCSRLKAGDADLHGYLSFAPPWDEAIWPEELKKAYSSFQAKEPTKDSEDDDIPF